MKDLKFVFEPKSVAVICASKTEIDFAFSILSIISKRI